ncbi:NUDIX hydrolase [Rapidithrix thailandica]|uniref:NUDIX hydrolase n=1 Tax=Rapidithrix thailandica TaxID=413964 RepID=A0AAW9S8Q0_9BACT
MNFCSNCGSKQISLKIPEGDSLPRFCCEQCGEIFYQNPKIVVGCLPVFEDKILMCKRAIEPRAGFWNLPAGYLENGETAEEGAIRETYEEAHAQVEIIRLHVLYSIPQFNQVYLHFLARMKSPDFSISTLESTEVRMFAYHEIPWQDIAFSSSTFAIEKFLEAKNSSYEGVHRGYFPGIPNR